MQRCLNSNNHASVFIGPQKPSAMEVSARLDKATGGQKVQIVVKHANWNFLNETVHCKGITTGYDCSPDIECPTHSHKGIIHKLLFCMLIIRSQLV